MNFHSHMEKKDQKDVFQCISVRKLLNFLFLTFNVIDEKVSGHIR